MPIFFKSSLKPVETPVADLSLNLLEKEFPFERNEQDTNSALAQAINDPQQLNEFYKETLQAYVSKNGRILPTKVDGKGYNILHWAVVCNQPTGHILSLLSQGVEINHPTKTGYTALHLAAKLGYFNIVQFLLEHSADIHCTNIWFETPLDMACFSGYQSIVALLVKYGAKIDGDEFHMPLLSAAAKGHAGVVQFLLEKSAGISLEKIKSMRASAPIPDHIMRILAIAVIENTIDAIKKQYQPLLIKKFQATTLAARDEIIQNAELLISHLKGERNYITTSHHKLLKELYSAFLEMSLLKDQFVLNFDPNTVSTRHKEMPNDSSAIALHNKL